jgi:hypothetical protein
VTGETEWDYRWKPSGCWRDSSFIGVRKDLRRIGRRLSAIMSADVVGYSRLMGLDETGTVRILREHRAVSSEWKGIAVAEAGRNAVFAVWLARAGLTGPAPIFEGKTGVFQPIARSDPTVSYPARRCLRPATESRSRCNRTS